MKKVSFKLLESILIFLFVKKSSCQPIFNVLDFGAAANDLTEDTQAIQNAIDSAHSSGGGIVYFPQGTYYVKPQLSQDILEVIALSLKSNVELRGQSRNNTVIKVIDNAGNFDAIIGIKPRLSPANNIGIKNLTIDANATNNNTPDQSVLHSTGSRSSVRFFICHNAIIDSCHFTNSKSIWNIVFNGIIENIAITNNIFDNIGDSVNDWDHSTIYTNGKNFLIERNSFYSRFGAGTFGARTAIEIHGSNQVIRSNFIQGFSYGINITGYSDFYKSHNQSYYDNIITDVLDGMILWSGIINNTQTANGLSNVSIFNNVIKINQSLWFNWTYHSCGSGIRTYSERERNIDSVYIFNNQIEFEGSPCFSAAESRHYSCIFFGKNMASDSVLLKNFYVLNNTFTSSNGSAIYVHDYFSHFMISNNLFLNSGVSPISMWDGFRSCVFVNENFSRLQISCNALQLTLPQPNTQQFFYQNGFNQAESYLFGNITPSAIPALVIGSGYSNFPVSINSSKPLIQFYLTLLI